jgi:hypothetical protein
VLEAQINFCIGGFWLPFNLFGLMLIVVASTSLAIRVHPGLTLTGMCIMMSCFLLVVQFVIMYFTSNSAAFSEQAIARQKRKHNTTFDSKALLSCKTFGIQCGSLWIIDREAMRIVMKANVDYTISAILTL